MIRVVGLTQHYGIRPVLKGISMEVERGGVVAVMGPNGVGKSTLMAVLGGVLSPQKGYVEINGLRRRGSPDAELKIRQSTTYLPDHPWLPMSRTGREFLLAVGRLYGIEDDRLFDHISRLLDLFQLRDLGNNAMSAYSSGQQKKIALCAALATEAEVLILDEPFTGGLDPGGIHALRAVLRRLARERGVTVVYSTPVPELVEELADRVAVLREGELAAYETLESLRGQGLMAEALERLVNPETFEGIQRYFESRAS